MPGKGWVRWTAEEQRVLARCARGVERGRYEAVARAARAFLRDVEQLRAVGGVPAEECGTLPIFPSDVKARHDARRGILDFKKNAGHFPYFRAMLRRGMTPAEEF
jgi:hypothetical protein